MQQWQVQAGDGYNHDSMIEHEVKQKIKLNACCKSYQKHNHIRNQPFGL